MRELPARARWRTTRLQAYTWHCGDEVCCCTQPVIERIKPNIKAGYPWIHRERIWEGVFRSERGFSEAAEDDAALKEAADKRNITVEGG